HTDRRDANVVKSLDEVSKASFSVSYPGRPPAAPKSPSEALKSPLTARIIGPSIRPVVLVPIQLDGQPPVASALHNKIDSIPTYRHRRVKPIAKIEQEAAQISFKLRLAQFQRLPRPDHVGLHRIPEVLDQS